MAEIQIQKCTKNGWPQDEPLQKIEESLLAKTEGVFEDDNERTVWAEWRLEGKIVKRSAHVTLKRNVLAEGVAQLLS